MLRQPRPLVPFAAPLSIPGFDLASGLVLYLKQDESAWSGVTGEVIDSSGQGNHGTAQGGATTTTGKFGKAGSFNGSTGYVNVPSAPALTPSTAISFGAWINPNSGYGAGSNPGIIAKKASWGGLWINKAGGFVTVRVVKSGGANVNYSAGLIATGAWTHVMAVANPVGTTVSLYINGALATSGVYDGTLQVGTDALTVGQQGGTDFLSGLIDEVRVYNRALSAAEVGVLYGYAV